MSPVYPQAIVLSVLAAITVAIDLPPLIWHFRNQNAAASCLIFWIVLLNVMSFINPIIWPNDDAASWWHGAGLCDVEVRVYVGSAVGMSASLMCVMRGLARVMDTRSITVRVSRAEQRARCIKEAALCAGLPVFFMVVYYVVQADRYFVTSVSGCLVSIDRSWVSTALVLVWPPIIHFVAVYFAVLIILRLRRYRRDLSSILSASSTTRSRFLRLFIMSATIILAVLPTHIFALASNAADAPLPYSWSRVHDPLWSRRVILVPSGGRAAFDRWIYLTAGFAVFAFFGTGEDATALYRSWAGAAAGSLGKIAGSRLAGKVSPSSLFSSLGGSRVSTGWRSGGDPESKAEEGTSWAVSSVASRPPLSAGA